MRPDWHKLSGYRLEKYVTLTPDVCVLLNIHGEGEKEKMYQRNIKSIGKEKWRESVSRKRKSLRGKRESAKETERIRFLARQRNVRWDTGHLRQPGTTLSGDDSNP